MELSKHALLRAQQRAISISDVEFVLGRGTPYDMVDLAVGYRVPGRELDTLISVAKQRVRVLERIRNKMVICSRHDGSVITVQHQTQRIKKKHHSKTSKRNKLEAGDFPVDEFTDFYYRDRGDNRVSQTSLINE